MNRINNAIETRRSAKSTSYSSSSFPLLHFSGNRRNGERKKERDRRTNREEQKVIALDYNTLYVDCSQ